MGGVSALARRVAGLILLGLIAVLPTGPAAAWFGASSGGESAEGTAVPDYLGAESRATLERIAAISGNMQAARGLLAFGVVHGAASPEGAVAAFLPGPDAADALSGLSKVERSEITAQIDILIADQRPDGKEEEFWERLREAVNSDGMASSSGEPHIVTLDGRRYGFQAAGEFVAVRSDAGDLEVQLRFEPWGNLDSATVNTAAAFRVGGDRVTVTYGDPVIVRLNGETVDLHNRGVELDGGGVLAEKNRVISVLWPDSSTARVTRAYLGHLDVWLRLAPGRAGAVHGLLGDFDGDPDNDLRLPDGRVLAVPRHNADDDRRVVYETFRNGWLVSAESSLFDYAEGQTTATFDRPEIPPVAVSMATLDPAARRVAERACGHAGLDDEDSFRQCVFDVALTGETGFAVSAVGAARRLLPVERRQTAGVVLRGSIDEAGAVDRHPIASGGARALFFVQERFDPALDLVDLGLYTRDGRAVERKCFDCGDLGLVRVDEPGRYVFHAGSPRDERTGSYRVRYWRVPTPDRFDVTLGDAVGPDRRRPGMGRIEIPGSADEYRFTVEAPVTVEVSVLAHDPALGLVEWQILDARGRRLAGTCLSCGTPHDVRLDSAGRYTLRVGTRDRDKGTGDYRISVSRR